MAVSKAKPDLLLQESGKRTAESEQRQALDLGIPRPGDANGHDTQTQSMR